MSAGNLPYNATTEAIQAHFSAVSPISIRHRTHKEDPSRSKGFAFLEFDGYERMATCLQKFHHSRFDDGSDKPRRINVELTWVFSSFVCPIILSSPLLHSAQSAQTRLTIHPSPNCSAGGGGKKSETRNERVKTKNAKLNDERKRRAQKEASEAQPGKGGSTVPAADAADAKGEDASGGPEAGNAKAKRRPHDKSRSKNNGKVKANGRESSERVKEKRKQGQVQPDGGTDLNIHPSRRNRFHA